MCSLRRMCYEAGLFSRPGILFISLGEQLSSLNYCDDKENTYPAPLSKGE